MPLSFTYYFLCLSFLFSCMRFVLCFFFVFLSPTFFIHTSFYDTYLFFLLMPFILCPLMPTFFIYASSYDIHLFIYLCFLFSVLLCLTFFLHPFKIHIFFFTYAFYFLSSYANLFYICILL